MSLIASYGPRLKVIAMVLAGGEGQRLHPLTRDRAKPAVPFGGIYRIIDFTLSNCVNSGIRRVFVLTQYKSSSLDYHIHFGWDILSHELGEFIRSVPPQQRTGTSWYLGTADAIYQNVYTLEQERPHLTLVLSGDHVYKMNYRAMLDFHIEKSADLTIACIPVPKAEASRFGVAVIDRDCRIIDFKEKVQDPPAMPGNPDFCLASMGVYLFNTPELVQQVNKNFKSCPETDRDFGRNIIPAMIREKMVYAHDFKDENKKPQKYWRDIGTRDAYWEANMDLVEVDPVFNLYDPDWPIRTAPLPFPPAKTVFNELGPQGRRGEVLNSLISPGCIISGGHVERSILSPNVRVEEGARVTESIIMDDCTVGRAATVHRAIIDKGVHVPDRTTIGLDRDADSRRYTITTKGIVIVPRGMQYT